MVIDTEQTTSYGIQDTLMTIGRNRPCPCNSGKKYKLCCLTTDMMIGDDNTYKILQDLNTDNMLYHITTPENWEKIKKEGLKGGFTNSRGYDLKGNIYFTDKNDHRYWNSISSTQIQIGSGLSKEVGWKKIRGQLTKLHNKSYVVIGIPIELFNQVGLEIHNDTENGEVSNWDQNQKFVSVGDQTINPIFITKIYDGLSDLYTYETKDRWDFMTDKIYGSLKETQSLPKYIYSLMMKPFIKNHFKIGVGGLSISYKNRKTQHSLSDDFCIKIYRSYQQQYQQGVLG